MKGFVFVEDGEIGLRFAAAEAFRVLATRHDLVFVAVRSRRGSPQVRERLVRSGFRVRDVPVHNGRHKRWQESFNISCLTNRHLSPSFEQRCNGLDQELVRRLQPFATPSTYLQMRARLERQMGLHPELLALTEEEKPDFFVMPSGLADVYTDDALQLAAALSIPTLLLVAGWDNPSSKGLLYRHPTLIGAWGEQSRRHVVDVQQVPVERVRVVGAPHFEVYRSEVGADRETLRRRWGLPTTGKVLVFAGTLRLFDETSLLRSLDAAIESGSLGDVHVLYRPHPWRFQRKDEERFDAVRWRHVTMDPTMAEVYQAGSGRPPTAAGNFIERSRHLHELYTLCDAVITPMSSLLLESMLNGLPVMAVAFGDGKHSWSADKVAKMLHFEELYRIPEVGMCREPEAFLPAVEKLLGQVEDRAHRSKLRELAGYFLYEDERSYSERVADLVDELLRIQPGPPRYGRTRVRPGRSYRLESMRAYSPLFAPVRYIERQLARVR